MEGSSALIGERTSSTPFEFHLGTAQRRPNCRARALGIATVEVLAVDFAGWGTLFPKASFIAKGMFARDAGDWPKLVDLYLPPERRRDASIVELFAPSQGSIASARSAA